MSTDNTRTDNTRNRARARARADERPADERPADERPADERPTDERPADEHHTAPEIDEEDPFCAAPDAPSDEGARITVPRLTWINGDAKYRRLGADAPEYWGGFMIARDQHVDTAPPWAEHTQTLTEGDLLEGRYSREITATVFALRSCWVTEKKEEGKTIATRHPRDAYQRLFDAGPRPAGG